MSQIDDTIEEKQNWHWRNTMRPVRFFQLDARAAIVFLAMLPFWARPFAWILMISSTALFLFLERRGLTFPSALRAFRTWLLGPKRPAWISMRRKRLVDYG